MLPRRTLSKLLGLLLLFFLSLHGIAATYVKNAGKSFKNSRQSMPNHKGFHEVKKPPSLKAVFFGIVLLWEHIHHTKLTILTISKCTV